MKLLFVSNLFPDEGNSVRGSDNAELLRCLRKSESFDIRVISPRPSLTAWTGNRCSVAVPSEGDSVFAPIFPKVRYLPKFGGRWNDMLMQRDLEQDFRRLINEFQPDVVLGSWLFPDGCALARLCDNERIPLVLITQGTDTHGYLGDSIRRRKIVEAIGRCEKVICRSADLARRLREAGAAPEKLHVVYNGVDPDTFRPIDSELAKQRLGIVSDAPSILFVGNFLPVKNPLFLVQAHAIWNTKRASAGKAPACLRMIGTGPLLGAIQAEAIRLGTANEVEILGRCSPEEVSLHMNAADLLCLTSRNEGFPNVIHEAMACNLLCISTEVGGIAERINHPRIGTLVPENDPESYIKAIESTLERTFALEDGAESPSWERSANDYAKILREATSFA